MIIWKVVDFVFGWIETSFAYGAKICTVIMYTSIVIAGYYSSKITEKLYLLLSGLTTRCSH